MTPKTVHLTLPRTLLEACRAEATRTYPLETGGVLMGERAGPADWRIDYIIGPGQKARHERYRFSPDLDWHHAMIAERFNATEGRSTYLGDWHSHPGARHGRMSYVDRSAARTILQSPESQCDRLLMGILWGRPYAWTFDTWTCETHPGWPWQAGVRVAHVQLQVDEAFGRFIG